jgi:GDSL-like lipase/acylhydrolase family protein
VAILRRSVLASEDALRSRAEQLRACSVGARLGLAVSSTLLALLLLEGICRVIGDRLPADKAFVFHDPYDYATCYPTDGFDPFPLDLRNEQDARLFRARFPDAKRFQQLRTFTPHCLIYDRSPASPRALINAGGGPDRIAVLGDSFAFGEGVTDDHTFGYRLASLRQAMVRVYAWSGADIEQIETQFRAAIDDAVDLRLNHIIYVFVLNDPLKTAALEQEEAQINDFMNITWSRAFLADTSYVDRAVKGLGRRSLLWQRVARAAMLARATRKSIAWYRDVFDESRNPPVIETFDRIQRMDRQARGRGIRFHLVVYPLMLDFRDYPLESAHDAIRRLATERGIPIVDLLPAFERRAGEALTVHSIDLHPDARAHEIAADATAASIWGSN